MYYIFFILRFFKKTEIKLYKFFFDLFLVIYKQKITEKVYFY